MKVLELESQSARLDEYDKQEWWDVARAFRPDLTHEEYEQMWAEFAELKRSRSMQ